LIAGVFILAGSFLFLGYAAYVGWDTVKAHVSDLNYWLLGLGLLCYPLGFLPTIWNWHTIMSRLGRFDRPVQNARMYCLSCLPKRIPGSIWYVASRIALYRDHEVDASATLAATATETVVLFLSGISVYVVTSAISLAKVEPALGVVAIAVFLLALIAPIWTPIVCRRICRLLAGAGISVSVDLSSRDVFYLLGTSTLAWIGGGWLLYLVCEAVTAVSFTELPRLIGAWGAAGAVSLVAGLLIQGMGLREVTLTMLLSRLMSLPTAALVSVLFRLLLMVGEVFWALAIMWLIGRFARQSP
jgi:hypothetical protein